MFEWCVNRCGSKNGHQKDMGSKEIGLNAQILSAILGLVINIFFEGRGRLLGHFMVVVLLALMSHDSNMEAQNILQTLAQISYRMCTSEINMTLKYELRKMANNNNND